MQDVRARLYVAHDHADAYLPFSESLQLANAAEEHTTVVFRSFVLFAHLYPTNDASQLIFLREVWNLYWHVVAVLGRSPKILPEMVFTAHATKRGIVPVLRQESHVFAFQYARSSFRSC